MRDQNPQLKQPKKPAGILLPAALMLFALPFAAIQYKVPSILQSLITDLPIDGTLAPWLITAFTIAGVAMTLLASPLADKAGVKAAVILAAVFSVAGSAIGAFMHEPIVLIVTRALEGVGFGVMCVVGPLIIERRVPVKRQGLANGIWGVWLPAGAFVGEVAAPVIYEGPLGFAGLWLVLALPLIPLLLLVLVVLGTSSDIAQDQAGEEQTSNSKDGLGFGFMLFLIAWLSFNVLNFALMSYGPSYMQETGMSASLSGFVTTIPMLLSLATGPIGGAIIDKFGHPKLILLVALAVNCVTTVMLFTQSGAMLWVSAILLGIFGTVTFVATLSAIPLVIKSPAAYAAALSIYMFIQCGGELGASVISPLVLGSSLDNWPAFAIFLGVFGIFGFACAFLTKYRDR